MKEDVMNGFVERVVDEIGTTWHNDGRVRSAGAVEGAASTVLGKATVVRCAIFADGQICPSAWDSYEDDGGDAHIRTAVGHALFFPDPPPEPSVEEAATRLAELVEGRIAWDEEPWKRAAGRAAAAFLAALRRVEEGR